MRMRVAWAKEGALHQPMKWCSGVPLSAEAKRVVPSGMTPWPCVARMVGQRFVLDDAQKMQSGCRHSGV